ncbi:hypothetical protein AB1Y20_002333 [Prymnesium parvum]|uniref:Ribosomal RNA-processing protein 40 n=1 Tax=Prymnesium parvum TaxID=97485 RepID=A0AB34JBG1_PRYPA
MGLTSAPQRAVRLPLRNRGVFPGDVLQAVDAFDSVLLGPGVFREGRELVATRAGILRWDEAHHRLWVENDQKRYIPALHDHVIGVVSDKNAEEYRLDIGAPATAVLPLLAFDGASKRNRPQLHVGSLVYCRVVVAHRDMEPEVSCKAPPGVGAAKDWVTRESVFGKLQAGHVFDCPAIVCRGLMDAQGPLLDALADVGAFELAVGVNGRVWVDAEQERMVVLVQNAILQSQGWPLAEHTRLVKTLQQSFS